MQGLQAALKLCTNLLAQFEPADAQVFAAFVLAKVSLDSGESIQYGINSALQQWAEMLISQMGASGKIIDGGNCTCLAPCTVRHTNQGPLVIHFGSACADFQKRFPVGGPTRAQDSIGWNNWYASEKQDQPGGPDDESYVSPPSDPDRDSALRFSLLELK